VVAFLVSTPELGPEALTLTVRFFGWSFAIVRLVAALALAAFAGLLFARLGRTAPGQAGAAGRIEVGEQHAGLSPLGRAAAYFDDLLLHVAPWTFVGLVAAALIEISAPPDALAELGRSGWDIPVIALVSVPTYVCAASATPLAAVLLAKGISPGAILVGLLLGPATNIATLAVLRRAYGGRATVLGILGILLACAVMAIAVNATALPLPTRSPTSAAHVHSPGAWIATAALTLALLAQLWRRGVVPWFSILDIGGHAPQHRHEHGEPHDPLPSPVT
jgi:hypothetical protein